ncbi:MAG TPA: hypothetical protein VFO07_20615 [Roseiflexaceae bacterium]|nr:hypothetical protein [Roseiflexaceae bacterium]
MPSPQPATPTLVAIRAAHHPETTPKYDRVVFEFVGPVPYLRVEYVPKLIADGSGAPVPVTGRAILSVQLTPARAHSDRGQVTAPRNIKLRLPLAKEIVSAGDFEAVVTYGIGLARKAETRIITMASASRLVIDFLL